MLEDYIVAGFDPAAFWCLSPRLYLAHMKAANERRRAEQHSAAWLAWHTAGLHRAPKFPEFADFANPATAVVAEQTPEQLQTMFNALAIAWGAKGQQ